MKGHAALRLCDSHSAAVQLILQKKVPELDSQAQPLQLVITAELRFQKSKSSHLFAYFRRNTHSNPEQSRNHSQQQIICHFKTGSSRGLNEM